MRSLNCNQVHAEPEFLEAAKAAIEYETDTFVSAEGNWPDLRTFKNQSQGLLPGQRFMCTWCHGAPGILLGRIGGLNILDSDSIRNDIHTALHTTKQSGLQARDHLCCGNMGRAEVLLTAGLTLSQPPYIEEAVKLDFAGRGSSQNQRFAEIEVSAQFLQCKPVPRNRRGRLSPVALSGTGSAPLPAFVGMTC